MKKKCSRVNRCPNDAECYVKEVHITQNGPRVTWRLVCDKHRPAKATARETKPL